MQELRMFLMEKSISLCRVEHLLSVIPIEVKDEENLRAKSLRAFCDKYNPDYAVRTSMSDYREQDWMTNIPLYNIDRITSFTSR